MKNTPKKRKKVLKEIESIKIIEEHFCIVYTIPIK
jgi:hypothetical protein